VRIARIRLFDACVRPEAKPVLLDRYLSVYAAVDASVKRDSTALCAVSWSAKEQQVRLINHKIIQPAAEAPVDFEATVERTLLDWRNRYNLIAVYDDPYQMVSSAQRLTKEGVMMFEYPQTVPNLTESSQNLFDLIKGANISLYPDEQIRLAVSRAVAIETPRGWRIGKDKAAYKVDIQRRSGLKTKLGGPTSKTFQTHGNVDRLKDGERHGEERCCVHAARWHTTSPSCARIRRRYVRRWRRARWPAVQISVGFSGPLACPTINRTRCAFCFDAVRPRSQRIQTLRSLGAVEISQDQKVGNALASPPVFATVHGASMPGAPLTLDTGLEVTR
jgi:hypothetical protein